MSSQASAAAGTIVEDNGYAAIRQTDRSFQVLGWYTPPWTLALLTPFGLTFVTIVALWMMFRTRAPTIFHNWLPGFDGPIQAFIDLFRIQIARSLGSYNVNFGDGMDPALLLGTLAALAVLMGSSLLVRTYDWGPRIMAQLLRFPLRVEIFPDRIIINRRAVQRSNAEAFSVEPTPHTRNRRKAHSVYEQSLSVILETNTRKIRIANVYGLDRADGIVLVLQDAMRRADDG